MDIIFDGPPSHKSGRFIEVEFDGESASVGEWQERSNGLWALHLTSEQLQSAAERTQRIEQAVLWIDVRQGRPPVGKRVMVTIQYSDTTVVSIGHLCGVRWTILDTVGRFLEDQGGQVTHWKDLPEPGPTKT